MTSIDMEADAIGVGTDADIASVHKLSNLLIRKNAEVDELENRLKQAKLERDKVKTDDLPAAMEAAGMEKFTLNTGDTVSLKTIVRASIPSRTAIEKTPDPDRREELAEKLHTALAWLKNNNCGAIIKNVVQVELGTDSEDTADDALEALRELGLVPIQMETVHPQTLTKLVKEFYEQGKIGTDEERIFSVFTGREATVKLERKGISQ